MPIDKFREPGTLVWFEYHCWEDHNSADAELWYHSHQQVIVGECDNPEYGDVSQEERYENGMPLAYEIKFADGFAHTGMEDELLDSREEFECSDPPEPIAEAIIHKKKKGKKHGDKKH